MRRMILFILFINQSLGQIGFPKQFQATLNISGTGDWDAPVAGVKEFLYDCENLRFRFDIHGWRSKQNETYMIKYKPDGAEADSPASAGFTIFNLNPDFPDSTKNDCWYRTNSMIDIGPFPVSWLHGVENYLEIKPWFPLPSNLINKGEEWVPEIQQNATRYDSPEICDLQQSHVGKVPCFSYFETHNRPVKTIQTRAASGIYGSDDGIPSEVEHLFNLPAQWPSYCGNANIGFTVESPSGFVVTPDSPNNFSLKLQTPPVNSLGDHVNVEFKVQSSGRYNGTRCATFNTIVFNKENWNEPQQVNMSFGDYGCCIYAINGHGGGYEWQYAGAAIIVLACDERAGYGCKGKQPCDV